MAKYNYETVRYSPLPRVAVLPSSGGDCSNCNIGEFSTIVAHLYRGTYYPGSLPHADYPTNCRISMSEEGFRFHLEMSDTNIKDTVKQAGNQADSFWHNDFVSLNFIDGENRVLQIAFNPSGQVALFRGYKKLGGIELQAVTSIKEASWNTAVFVPFSLLKISSAKDAGPIPFDIVRYTKANAAISSWAPIPDQLPFNENYIYPVFCFGLISQEPVRWSEYAGVQASRLGKWAYEGPESITAGSYVRFKLKYTAGAHGLQVGGGLRFLVSDEVLECNRKSPVLRSFPEKDWTPLQWTDPRAPGYISVESSREGCSFELSGEDPFSTSLKLTGIEKLVEGDTIVINVGTDPAGPGIRSQQLTRQNLPLKCFVDIQGNGIFIAPNDFPSVHIKGRSAQSLVLNCTPTPDPGQQARLVIAAVDYIGNISEDYSGTIRFFCKNDISGLPRFYSFKPEDRGTVEFKIKFSVRGIFVIDAADCKAPDINGQSNLIVTDGSFGPEKIYFGDIHNHSQHSDGRLTPLEKYRETALHRGLDFWALTDHCHDLTPKNLNHLNELNEKLNRDNYFVTIPAYEWTNSMGQGNPSQRKLYGHRNVYFNGPIKKVFDGVSPSSDDPCKLLNQLKRVEKDFVIINHFHCGLPDLFPEVDDAVEISGWCSNSVKDDIGGREPQGLQGKRMVVRELFDQTSHLGVVAGTDHGSEAYHTTLPAEMTAVLAPELKRDSLLKSLKKGKTYATSGQKTLLKFSVNKIQPGGCAVNEAEQEIEVVAGSVTPVLQVEIFKDGRLWQSVTGETKPRSVSRWSFKDKSKKGSKGHYWVRVRTAQGFWTWSSPVYYNVL